MKAWRKRDVWEQELCGSGSGVKCKRRERGSRVEKLASGEGCVGRVMMSLMSLMPSVEQICFNRLTPHLAFLPK